MAMASWMIRGRSSRTGRPFRSRRDSEDDVQLDLTKDTGENTKHILLNICKKQGLSDGKRYGYLNALVKLISRANDAGDFGYSVEQLFCCLQVAVAHDATQVRAAALRAVRYLLKEERDVKTLHNLQYPYLIARSFDLSVHSDAERMQALRLIRRMLVLAPSTLSPGLVRSLVSLANGAAEEKDRMLRVCLATLSEICVLNTEVFISCGGVTAIQRNLLECSMPRIAESLCGVLLFLLNNPVMREKAGVRLQALAAPFCDFHWDPSRNRDERDVRFHCSRLALLSVLRSWPGVLHFCHPGDNSGLRSIVNILYVQQLEVRKAVLDLLYELLGLPLPEWTDEFSVALQAVDPSHPRDSWRLSEGFVAAEGRSILPHLAKCKPNLVEMHLSLLLYTFLEVGLLEAIAKVIVTADTFISVRATVLLGELLHLIHLLLPPDCCNLTPPLPTLLSEAANREDPAAQIQALGAIAALARLQTILKKQPAPASVFLDQLLQRGVWGVKCRNGGLPPVFISDELGLGFGSSSRLKREKSKLYQIMLKDSDDVLRESMVLSNKDGFSWNWNIVRAILKSRSDALKRLEDSNYKTFLRRLVQYYKPSSNRFSRVELSSKRQMNIYTLTGFELLDCLLETEETEGQKLLSEFLADLWLQIDAITSSRSAHDCLFSPQHVSNSLCQDYFLFIGRLCRTSRGLRILEKAGILQQLLNLVVATNHECYVKLVVAGLDYTLDAMPRIILSKVLTAGVEVSRLYATQHMLVLLRACLPNFDKWGIELLVMQLYDSSQSVSSVALNILLEAVEEKACLESLVNLRPTLLHLGDKGLLLLISFLSIPLGFSFLHDAGFVATELDRWASSFNCRYVRLVEGELHDSLTLHQRGEDGRYSQRVTSARHYVKDVLVPPHLYGQLVQHSAGLSVLKQDVHLPKLFQVLCDGLCEKELDTLQLKAALWAVGHIGTSDEGVTLLQQAEILGRVVHLAEQCVEYAVRATAFFCLGLLSTTATGADFLNQLGWLSVRHDRHDQWPIIEEHVDPDLPYVNSELEIEDNYSLSSGVGGGVPEGMWDLEPGGEPLQERIFFMAGDDESGNEDEGMMLEDSTIPTHWASDIKDSVTPSASGSKIIGEGGMDVVQKFSTNQTQQKSATLPHWRPGLPPPSRHTRSLSESKQLPPQIVVASDAPQARDSWIPSQITKIRSQEVSFPSGTSVGGSPLIAKPDESKSRSNSCTDSSGISSCDSGPGRQITSERIPPTLSPIPSSASLHTLQSSGLLRRASQISQRKLSASTHGSITSEHSSPSDTITAASSMTRLSQQDLLGYATLRNLNRHRRPLLTESSSGKGDSPLAFDDSFPLSMNVMGTTSPASSVRALKARSLDRHFSHPTLGELESRMNPLLAEERNASSLECNISPGCSYLDSKPIGGHSKSEPGHPCYMGICLPRDLMVLFPRSGQSKHVSRRRGSTSFSELEQLPEVGQEIEPSTSSDSEDTDEVVSSGSKQGVRKRRMLHSASLCIVCSRLLSRKMSAGSFHRHRTDTDTSQGGLESQSPILLPPSHHKSQSISSGGGGDTVVVNTPIESISSSTSVNVPGYDFCKTSQKLLYRDILKHVNRMSNPVWAKVSKQSLIQLKQKNANAFQDVCLYSAVCRKLASCTYRHTARRFIQELFLDLDLEVLYDENISLIQKQQIPVVELEVVPSSKIDVSSKTLVSASTSQTNPSKSVPPGSISALSIKLASTMMSPSNNTSNCVNNNNVTCASPSEVNVLNEVKGNVEVSLSEVRPSGSDPVPISAPSKTGALSGGFMIRSPPLEVVKEEPAPSVSSSEQPSPVDTSSIISNGQVEEENVAFLNQKFDDIPMIDEGQVCGKHSSSSFRENVVSFLGKSSNKVVSVSETNITSDSETSNGRTVLVNKNCRELQTSVPTINIRDLPNSVVTTQKMCDSLAESSSVESNIKNVHHTKGHSSSTVDFTKYDDTKKNFGSDSTQGCSSQGLDKISDQSNRKSISTSSSRQRKVATTSAPDVASLRGASCLTSSNAHVPSQEKPTSNDNR